MKKIVIMLLLLLNTLNLFSNSLNSNKFKPEKHLIYLDPGHQLKGNYELEEIAPNSKTKKAKVSSGTRGVATKKNEYELTLEIALKLRETLKEKGYQVKMTRETHNVNISNKERAILVNKSNASLYIRLHADGNSNKNVKGASVLTSSPKNKYTSKVQKESEKFSRILIEEYTKITGAKNRGVSYRDDLTGTNWTIVPNTLLEMGFMTNAEEDLKMSNPDYQKKIIIGIVNGIEKYLKENKG